VKRRTVRLPGIYAPRFGHPIRIEFGPWYWRWWKLLTTNCRYHVTGIGEPCLVYPDYDVPDLVE
jgi:hypothetical protein